VEPGPHSSRLSMRTLWPRCLQPFRLLQGLPLQEGMERAPKGGTCSAWQRPLWVMESPSLAFSPCRLRIPGLSHSETSPSAPNRGADWAVNPSLAQARMSLGVRGGAWHGAWELGYLFHFSLTPAVYPPLASLSLPMSRLLPPPEVVSLLVSWGPT
jgi:hypothetical protein